MGCIIWCIRNINNIQHSLIFLRLYNFYDTQTLYKMYKELLTLEILIKINWSISRKLHNVSRVTSVHIFIIMVLKQKLWKTICTGNMFHMLKWEFWWRIQYNHLFMSHTLLSEICLRFSSNSEAYASELLENLKEMFLQYYMYSE